MSSILFYLITLIIFVNVVPSLSYLTPKAINNGNIVRFDYPKNTSISKTVRQSQCSTIRQLRLAAAFDSTFCALYGTTFETAAYMVSTTVEQAAEPLLRDACIELSLYVISGHCNAATDPYIRARGTPDQILNEFIAKWTVPAGLDANEIDATYLFIGFEDGTNALGFAVNSGVCSKDNFGWVEKANGLALAHELGHSLSCRHVNDGIMKSSLTPVAEWKYSQESLNSISSFNSKSGSCLTSSENFDAKIFGGSKGKTCLDVRKSKTQYKGGKYSETLGADPYSFKLVLKQRKSVMKVSFKGIKTKFVGLAFRLATIDTIDQFEMGEMKRWSNGRGTVKYKIPFKKIMVPEGKSICCGEKLYMHFNIEWCRENILTSGCARQLAISKVHTIKCK